MKTKTMTILLLTILVLCLGCINVAVAKKKEPPERFKGYNTEKGKWMVGNLGKAYFEGDWVSYQLRIDKASKIWGDAEFNISYNFFQPSKKAIYVDAFDTSADTGFQWSIQDFLPNTQQTPPISWGTHIPTPEAGEPWISGPKIINYMDAWPPGTDDGIPPGSSPAKERYFTVSGMPWGAATTHIILFFRARLALSIIWSEGLEANIPTELDGDEFETWTAAWHGASFASGASRHFYLKIEGVGDKTIPIPTDIQLPTAVINGHKYVCIGPGYVLFDGWEITLTGVLADGTPYTPKTVYTGTSPWGTGYFEFIGLVAGSYTVQEEIRFGYSPANILTSGDGTNEVKNIPEGWVSFDLAESQSHTVDFYND